MVPQSPLCSISILPFAGLDPPTNRTIVSYKKKKNDECIKHKQKYLYSMQKYGMHSLYYIHLFIFPKYLEKVDNPVKVSET